jgi:hypothetical protein
VPAGSSRRWAGGSGVINRRDGVPNAIALIARPALTDLDACAAASDPRCAVWGSTVDPAPPWRRDLRRCRSRPAASLAVVRSSNWLSWRTPTYRCSCARNAAIALLPARRPSGRATRGTVETLSVLRDRRLYASSSTWRRSGCPSSSATDRLSGAGGAQEGTAIVGSLILARHRQRRSEAGSPRYPTTSRSSARPSR